jgi:16S rRNA (cytosine967-C5)-methyltransferase
MPWCGASCCSSISPVPAAVPRERRLAILGFAGDRDFLKSALNEPEKAWLDQVAAVDAATLPERYRHNLPEWLVAPLKEQLGDDFWPLVDSLNQSAPLDLRVNALTDKREDVRKELALAGIPARPTPHSPWGLRLEGKPALTRLDAFARGAIEVQDEGSQLLALLTDARRGQMVVDFCAGAGGKTLALGAMMRNTGRLYAFDVSAHRLENLKPRLARSQLSNVHRPRSRTSATSASSGWRQDRPGDRGCALFRAGNAATQPRT